MDRLTEKLTEKGWLVADGATGTNLFIKGLETGHPPELWNDEHPERVTALHTEFIEAGADILLTNSFGANRLRLKLHKAEDRVAELNKKAVRLACQARDMSDSDVLIAGSMGPTGELFEPLGALTPTQARDVFAEQAEALAEAGADILQIETISSLDEAEAGAEAALATGLPVLVTMTFDTAGRSMMGVTPADYAVWAGEKQLHGYGANCGIGPAELLDSVMGFGAEPDGPLVVAKGNCGIPEYVEGHIHYHGTPELMARYAVLARDAGASVIGGCCGTSAEHLKAMVDALNAEPKAGIPDAVRLEAELGTAWAGLDTSSSAPDRGGRGGRRRRR